MLDTFTLAYLEAALWAEGLDEYGIDDIDLVSLEAEVVACQAFQAANQADLVEADYPLHPDYGPTEMSGHDFYLTRNGHGTGFWDRGLGEVGERLTQAAHAMGESSPYAEDGKIHFGG